MFHLFFDIWESSMTYTSLSYLLLVGICLVLYYLLPLRFRWYVLLIGSAVFYYYAAGKGKKILAVFLLSIVISYLSGIIMDKAGQKKNKLYLAVAIVASALPLLLARGNDLFLTGILHKPGLNLIIPVGLSFYSLQMIAYLSDVFHDRIKVEKNFLKYALFISFFPQIIQGPIPRFADLHEQLTEGHRFDDDNFSKGFIKIIWGFFLKFMIADRAGTFVDSVFVSGSGGETIDTAGSYILLAGILYSIQLYTDFMACTTISQGVSLLFGIRIGENFDHPYFATSVQDFWRRWHISLSSWLRDYIYIPLGGNRKGKVRKYINVIITFAVSGIWHGGGLKFLFWGLMHAFYQVYEGLTKSIRTKAYDALQMSDDSAVKKLIRTIWTFFWVMLAWIIFRIDGLRKGIIAVKTIFTDFDGWRLFDFSVFSNFGLDWKDWMVLILSIILLFVVSWKEEHGLVVSDWIIKQHIVLRWTIYIVLILIVWVFGSYGYGFDAKDFIYGGF